MSPAATFSTPTEIVDFVVKAGHGVKGLADTGLETVPNLYVQPPEERYAHMKVLPEESIPIIDFTNWDDPHVAELISDASSKWGFFQIVNHGIPMKVVQELKASVHAFFELPVEEKRKYLKENSPAKTIVRLGTSFSPHSESALEWKDYLSMHYASAEAANAFWPPACKVQALEYMNAAKVFIDRLLKVLLKELNVNEIDKEKKNMLMGAPVLNFNYYPPCPNPDLATGVGRHSDASSITILLQDDIGGLFVRGLDGESWIHVPPIDGALVINIGDMLQVMSNGRYKSIEHRVVANGNKSRISVPIFLNPDGKAVIAPFPQVLESTGENSKYRDVVYADYFKYFFSKPHDGKKTIEYVEI